MTLADILTAQTVFLARSTTCPHCWHNRTQCTCPNHTENTKG